jgi:tetratricopeptide (TPR) repeat protein
LGNIYYQLERFADAEQQYLLATKGLGNCDRLFEYLAWTNHRLGCKKDSYSYAKQCLELSPENLSALLLKALSRPPSPFAPTKMTCELEVLAERHPGVDIVKWESCLTLDNQKLQEFLKIAHELLRKYPSIAILQAKVAQRLSEHSAAFAQRANELQPGCPLAATVLATRDQKQL